jgi:hypothetical protein
MRLCNPVTEKLSLLSDPQRLCRMPTNLHKDDGCIKSRILMDLSALTTELNPDAHMLRAVRLTQSIWSQNNKSYCTLISFVISGIHHLHRSQFLLGQMGWMQVRDPSQGIGCVRAFMPNWMTRARNCCKS